MNVTKTSDQFHKDNNIGYDNYKLYFAPKDPYYSLNLEILLLKEQIRKLEKEVKFLKNQNTVFGPNEF